MSEKLNLHFVFAEGDALPFAADITNALLAEIEPVLRRPTTILRLDFESQVESQAPFDPASLADALAISRSELVFVYPEKDQRGSVCFSRTQGSVMFSVSIDDAHARDLDTAETLGNLWRRVAGWSPACAFAGRELEVDGDAALRFGGPVEVFESMDLCDAVILRENAVEGQREKPVAPRSLLWTKAEPQEARPA